MGLDALVVGLQRGAPKATLLAIAEGTRAFNAAVATKLDAIPPERTAEEVIADAQGYKADGAKAAEDAKAEKAVTATIFGIGHWALELLTVALGLGSAGLGFKVVGAGRTIGALLRAGEVLKTALDQDESGRVVPERKERRKIILNNALDTADVKRIQAARRARGETV